MKTNTPHNLAGSKVLFVLLSCCILYVQSFAQAPVNDLCSGATVLVSSTNPTPTVTTLTNATLSAPAPGTACGTEGADVWYAFVAKTRYPFINLTSVGTNVTAANVSIQLFSGNCATIVNLACVSGVAFRTSALYTTGLTVGQTYYIRVYSADAAPAGINWDFSIAVTDPPANDECTTAAVLTPAVNPGTTGGTFSNTNITTASLPVCGSPDAGSDVWYSFVATSAYPFINVSGTGSNITATDTRIQLFSGSCGTLSGLVCSTGFTLNTATLYVPGLTLGQTYYIRLANINTVPTGLNWGFSIAVINAPPNDLCANAVVLASSIAPAAVTGTLNNATLSSPAIPTICGTETPDVWYTFQATSVYPSIVLSSTGGNLGTNGRIQLFSGSCGSLTNIACATGNSLNTLALATPLTIGTYYSVRVYSNNASPAGAGWNFAISVVDGPANDICANASVIVAGTLPALTPGTLNNATISTPAVTTACGTPGADVWYSFQATSVYPNIALSSTGASLGSNSRIQLFSGSCGALTNLVCATGNTLNTLLLSTALTVGNYYYVRIYSNTVAPSGTGWNFSISVTDPAINDVCLNATNLISAVLPIPVAGTLNGAGISSPSIPTACSTEGADVWYTFTAASAYPTILLSATGASLGTANAQIQLFSGDCTTLNSLGCASGNQFSTAVASSTALTIGNVYYIRLYSATLSPTGGTWGYNIAVADQPVNDECLGATLITSSTTCNVITGTIANSTPSAGTPAACSGTVKYDVWYKFIAQTTNPTIKLSNFGSSFNGQTPRVQLFLGGCGALTSINCGAISGSAISYTPTGLTVGATYYFRVYSITASAVPATLGNFDICIQDPFAPANDNCSGAVLLTPGASCSATAGTLLNSTATTGVPNDCGDAASPEVWYSFVATTPYHLINLNSVGAQLLAASPKVQLLSGTCGSFTSLACVSANAASNALNTYFMTGPAGLTVGNTYYIRVYTGSAGMSGTTWGFNICITSPSAPVVDYGKSYVNITKGSGGGTIEPGDELEMRTTVAVRSSMAFNTSFTGSVPANTTYVPGTMRILTNEGKIYKQWTDAADGDPATITGSAISFNAGDQASQTIGGILRSTDRPVASGGTMIIISYHVTVNAVPFGSQVSVGGGTFSYANSAGTPTVINFPAVTAIVYKNYGICTNTVGTNGILSENGGSFGSGTSKDRIASGNIPVNYTYVPFTTGSPGDYFYGMSNNTSAGTGAANYSIDPADLTAAHRVFGFWDIIGDHTGAADPLAGNLPTDVNNGQRGGYMAVINASYRTDTAFLDTVKNLCPNTSYEYSAWFRNICRKCGIDSTGKSWNAAGYVPTGLNDTSGVHPNLTFNINSYDYYTTGDMGYTGQWIKKGFTYRTGPSETQMIINIRNNAPGGGGNDWAIDDIGVSTCSPTLNLNPSTSNVNVCYGDGKSLSAEVISYFDNYNYYVWEKSIDKGVSFAPTPYSSYGTVTPVFNGTDYIYTATGPSFIGDSSTHQNIYRLRVASSPDNISDTNCSFLAVRTVQVYVNNCMYLLKTDFIHASGTLHNNFATVQWETAGENGKLLYEVEKSTDGIHFTMIGTVQGSAFNGNGNYTFNDPALLTGTGYYRIKMKDDKGFKYSKIILLSTGKMDFAIRNLVNPFSNSLSFDLVMPETGSVKIYVLDNFGRLVKLYTQTGFKGITAVNLSGLDGLSNGTYVLKADWQNESCIKRIIRLK